MEILYRVDLPRRTKSWVDRTGENDINQLLKTAVSLVMDDADDSTAWAVEFGAWDGKEHSHLSKLFQHFRLNAVFIEGDETRFASLRANYEDREGVYPFLGLVGSLPDDNLDSYLQRTPIPAEFELLIVDIDGNDYHVLNCLQQYNPKIIMVEFNPTIPNDVVYVQDNRPELNQGTSLLAFALMLEKKGYKLIGTHGCNALFVSNPCADAFLQEALHLDELHDDSRHKMVYFQLFDGTIKNAGLNYLLWDKITIDEQDIQCLPQSLRRFLPPDDPKTVANRESSGDFSIFNSYPSLGVTAADLQAENALVWGAGGRFKQFLDAGGNRIRNITVVDGNADLHGSTVYGHPVTSAKNVDLFSYDIIIICSTYFHEIVDDIRKMARIEALHIKYFDPDHAIGG